MNWCDVFDKETIENIMNNKDNKDQLLTIIHELVTHSYDLGYTNGYVAANDHTTNNNTFDPLMDREYNI